jgi:hypothetical protein
VKRGTPEHPKTKALAKLLNIPWAHAVGILELLWHFTAKFAPQGDIGKYSDLVIAQAVGWQRPTGRRGVTPECTLSDALVEAKWLDRDPERRLIVHDWEDHMDQSVERVLARRGLVVVKPKLAVPEPLPEPLPIATPATSAGASKTARRKVASASMTPEQESWFASDWSIYWLKVGKGDARRAFAKTVLSQEVADKVHSAIERQLPEMMSREPRFRKQFSGWLNGTRWEDEAPANGTLPVLFRPQTMSFSERNLQARNQVFQEFTEDALRHGKSNPA